MSRYSVLLTPKAEKEYKKLNPTIKTRLAKTISNLSLNQLPQQFKYLTGNHLAQFRVRVGDYRILYDIYHKDKTVLILRIGHRRDIYK